MPDQIDAEYFLKRAVEERRRADAADDTAAAVRHSELAEQYEERAKGRHVKRTIPLRG
ncbi:hypothetical protein [Stakelama marina]|uniref:Uncharacterized protein n=1 Tax=Stakelama marina TaxID=2826939 RepID=A0A8T4ICQ8_9SPHN|nr:hypothetical protein [Stakelama marina]MBR0552427.1 hypothetical protein [Stakelama marina]